MTYEEFKKRTRQQNQFYEQKRQFNSLSLGTFGDDLKKTYESLNKYLTGGWHDPSAGEKEKQSINALLSRIADTKNYMNTYASDYDAAELQKRLSELDELQKSLGEGLSYIDQQGKLYAGFKNADEYNAALSAHQNREELERFGSAYADLDSKALMGAASDLRSMKTSYDLEQQGAVPIMMPNGQMSDQYIDSVFKKYGTTADNALEYADKFEQLANLRYADMFKNMDDSSLDSYASGLSDAMTVYNDAMNAFAQLRSPENRAALDSAERDLRQNFGVTPGTAGTKLGEAKWIINDVKVSNLEKYVSQQADFAEKSKYTESTESIRTIEQDRFASLMERLNGTEKGKTLTAMISQKVPSGAIIEASFEEWMKKDGRLERLNYLYNLDREAAATYESALYRKFEKEKSDDAVKKAMSFASEHPWGASAASIGLKLADTYAGIENFLTMAISGETNDNSIANTLGKMGDAIRTEVPEAWAEKYGWDDSKKGVASFFYGTGMSLADSVANNLLYGGYGGGAGSVISLASRGLTASAGTVRAAKERGATDAQAFGLGVIGGVAEALFEKLPLDNLIKIKDAKHLLKPTLKEAFTESLKNTGKQMLTEGLEEMGTEAVNILADALIMMDKSELAAKYAQYKEEGLSDGEASLRTVLDLGGQVLLSGIGGAVSGGVMGSAFSAPYVLTAAASDVSQKISDGDIGNQILRFGGAPAVVRAGLSFGEGSEAYDIASRLQKRADHRAFMAQKNAKTGENTQAANSQTVGNFKGPLDASELGKLFRIVTTEGKKQLIDHQTTLYEQKLSEDGSKGNRALARAVALTVAGENTTEAQRRLIANSREAKRLISASETLLDIGTEFNPLSKATRYQTDEGILNIERTGSSDRYTVTFIKNEGGELKTLSSRTVSQVQGIIETARAGASFGELSERLSRGYAGEESDVTLSGADAFISAKAAGASDHVASSVGAYASAFPGLRISFGDAGTGRRGVFRTEYDGTRSVVINPNSVYDTDSVITHEIFHDLEKTEAGQKFIELATEYAKAQPAKSKSSGAANRYDEIVDLYKKDGRTRAEDIPGEVGAKVAGEVIAKEGSLDAVLSRMGKNEASEFTKKLKRAASAIKKRLSKVDKTEVKGAKLAEHRAEMMLELYTRAAKQRQLESVLADSTMSGYIDANTADFGAKRKTTRGSKTGKKPENQNVTTKSENKTQVSENKAAENKKASRDERGDIRESDISIADKKALKSIGGKKHINDFDSNDIKATEKWARILWEDLKEKSPFFRAWFGEWRAHSTDPVEVVTKKSDTRGLKKNKDTRWEINRSAKVSWEIQNSSASKSGYSYMPYIDGIIENAVLLDSAISDKDNENSLFYHYMYAVVDDGTGKHVVKLTVEEILNPGKETERRAYKLIDIEKYQPSGIGSPKLTSSQAAGTIKSIADLVAFVKSYDKNFSAAPEVSKYVLNDDGTPKVFYHGTDAKFYSFDPNEISDREGSFFFAENREDASAYGKNMFEVYLTGRNLANYDDQPTEFYKLRNKSKQVDWLKERGYDGWYADMDSGGWGELSVFSPEQIKSATDNIGTFDKTNPDIRYDLDERYDERGVMERQPVAEYKAYSAARMREVLASAVKLMTADELNRGWRPGQPYFTNIKTDVRSVAEMARQLSDMFNFAQGKNATEEDIKTVARAAADYLIANTYADDAEFAASLTEQQDLATRALAVLSHGLRRMTLGETEIGDIRAHYGKKKARSVVTRWRATEKAKGMVLPSEIAAELSSVGVALDVDGNDWNEADIAIALNGLYERSREVMREKIRSQIGGAEEYASLRDKIADQIYDSYRDGLSEVRVTQATAAAKVIVDANRARELARRKRETGALSKPEWKELTRSIGKIVKGYSISVPAVREFAQKYKAFIEKQAGILNELITAEDDAEIEKASKRYEDAKNEGDDQLLDIINPRIAAGIYAIAEGDESTALTADELEALHAGIRNLLALDRRYDRVHKEGRWQDTSKYSKQGIDENKSVFGNKKAKGKIGENDKVKAPWHQMFFDETEQPEHFAARMGGYNRNSLLAKSIHELQIASQERQYKEMQYMKRVEKFFDEHPKYHKRYENERVEFKYVRENPLTHQKVEGSITLTLGEFLSLYMTSKRKQAFISMAWSKITFDALSNKEEPRTLEGSAPDLSGLDETQIEAITRGMGNGLISQINKMYEEIATSEDKALVALIEDFFANDSKNDKMETDMLLYGYTNVVDGYYYPIMRDKTAFNVNLIGNDRILDSMIGVNNFSFNQKTVERANKPLIIRDALTVMQNHAHQLAVYTTMTVQLQNINRIYNCEVDIPGVGKTNLRSYIMEHASKRFDKYLKKYLEDVQGSVRSRIEDNGLINTLRSNYAKSVLALNPKSVATQFATVFAMTGQVSVGSWAKGVAIGSTIHRVDGLRRFEEMDKYSHGAAIRNDSNEQYLASGASGKLSKATDKLMFLQALTDRTTCYMMWNMCQYEIAKKNGLALGTEANKIEAGKLLDEKIIELQDTSGAATKTGLARSQSEFYQTLAMFKSSLLKQWSRLAYMAGEIRVHGLKGRRASYAKEATAFLLSNVYSVLIAMLFQALRGKWEEDKDGNPKRFEEVLLTELAVDTIGIIPLIGDLAEAATSGFDAFDSPLAAILNDTYSGLERVFKATTNFWEDFSSDGKVDQLGKHIEDMLTGLADAAKIVGIPARNVLNIMTMIKNGVMGAVSSSDKYGISDIFGEKNYVDDLKGAIEDGDTALAETIIDLMMYDRTGDHAGGEAASELADLYRAGYEGLLPSKTPSKVTVTVDGESTEIELDDAQKAAYSKEYSKSTGIIKRLIASDAYGALTSDERAKAISDVYSLCRERAKTKLFGADMSTAVAATYFISDTVYIAARAHIKAIKDDKSIKNKRVAIERYLRTLGLTRAEQRIVLYASGYRAEIERNAVYRALRALDASPEEKARVALALGFTVRGTRIINGQ